MPIVVVGGRARPLARGTLECRCRKWPGATFIRLLSLAPVHIYKCFLDAFFGITLAEAPLRRATAHYCRRPCASGQHRPSTRVASSVRRHTHIHMRVHAGPARFRSGGHACRAEGHATCSVRRQSLRRCHQPGGALCVAWGSRRSPRPPRRLSFKSTPRRCLWGGRLLFRPPNLRARSALSLGQSLLVRLPLAVGYFSAASPPSKPL